MEVPVLSVLWVELPVFRVELSETWGLLRVPLPVEVCVELPIVASEVWVALSEGWPEG